MRCNVRPDPGHAPRGQARRGKVEGFNKPEELVVSSTINALRSSNLYSVMQE